VSRVRIVGVWAPLIALAASVCANVALREQAPAAIRYTLEPVPGTADAEGYTKVRIEVAPTTPPARLSFRMPVWTPGEYRVQDHGRYVRRFRRASGARALARTSDGAWDAGASSGGAVAVSYELANAPAGIFTENVDVRARRAFYDGAATFAYVEGRTAVPVQLDVVAPARWQGPVTPLEPVAAPTGTGRAHSYRASGYDELADSPILIGESVTTSFELGGKPHRVALMGRTSGPDAGVYSDTLRAVARAASEYMGGLPYPRYVLFLDIGGRGGGLEHANSARIAWSPGPSSQALARFVAHEYFHLWNVKRIRPVELGPFDYAEPPNTGALWFCEGVTEYVAGLLTLRAGSLTEAGYLDGLAGSIATLAATPARRRVSAEAASRRIWEEGRSSGYGGLSVYVKGEMIGLCLDLEMLRLTSGRSGMRELMRELMDRHAPPKPGYGEDGIRDACVRIGGASLGPLYDRMCRTTEELPISQALGHVGLRIESDRSGAVRLTQDPNAPPSARRLRAAWLYGGRGTDEGR
jgi:predicted metalloprotease with PDZ domain